MTGRRERPNPNAADPALREFASELLLLAPSDRGVPWAVERLTAALKRRHCGVAHDDADVAAMEDLASQIVQSAGGDHRDNEPHAA